MFVLVLDFGKLTQDSSLLLDSGEHTGIEGSCWVLVLMSAFSEFGDQFFGCMWGYSKWLKRWLFFPPFFSSFFFFYFFLFSLWIYYPSSTLSIYSTLRRENCRCSQRLQSFRKSVGCNISQMRAISLSGAAHVFIWSEKTQFSKELKCAWRNSTPWGCLWIVGHGCAAPSLAGSWTRGYWVLLQLV